MVRRKPALVAAGHAVSEVLPAPGASAHPLPSPESASTSVPSASPSAGSGPCPPILDALGTAIAAADPATWAIRYENTRFREWFPAGEEGGGALATRLRGLEVQRARERVEKGRPYRFETEVRVGPRTISVQTELRLERDEAGELLLLVEGQNISKQKEAEYMLESYSRLTERQNRELEKEKERVEKLLLNIMPRSVYEELKDSGTTTPQAFEDVSVLMLDFAGFTDMAISRDPGALIAELNDVFTSLDRIIEHFHCERIKTIGDAYMAVAGMPELDPEHTVHLARAALRMRRFLERRNESAAHRWRCRIGIGSGPVIGSIVGIQKFVYDIFGPAVNMASRLEALAEPMQILVTPEVAERLRGDFVLRSLGEIEIKGFGIQERFSLEDESREGR
jgi:adenylate cyclase